MKLWKCQKCGYIHKGVSAPENCSACGAPEEQFVEIEPVNYLFDKNKNFNEKTQTPFQSLKTTQPGDLVIL